MMTCEVEKKDSERGEFREIWENENKSMFVDVCVRGYKRLDYTHGKHFLTQKKCCMLRKTELNDLSLAL